MLQLSALRRRAERYDQGHILANQGDATTDVFLLINGAVEVHRDGLCVDTATEPGTFFGLFAMFADGTRSATLVVRDAVEIVRIREDRLAMMLEQAPSLGIRMVQDTARLFLERETAHDKLRDARAPGAVGATVMRHLPALALMLMDPPSRKLASEVLEAFRDDLRETGLDVDSMRLDSDFPGDEMECSPDLRTALSSAKESALDAKRSGGAVHPFRKLLDSLTIEY